MAKIDSDTSAKLAKALELLDRGIDQGLTFSGEVTVYEESGDSKTFQVKWDSDFHYAEFIDALRATP